MVHFAKYLLKSCDEMHYDLYEAHVNMGSIENWLLYLQNAMHLIFKVETGLNLSGNDILQY